MDLKVAYAQKDFTRQGTFEGRANAAGTHLYLWRPAESKWATIAWCRFVDLRADSFTFDAIPDRLALTAYSASTGLMNRDSSVSGQNVQQIQATLNEPMILRVAALSKQYQGRGRNLSYGLAHSGGTLEQLNGPSLSVACQAPGGTITASSSVRIECTAWNNGDMIAINPRIQLWTAAGALVSTVTMPSLVAGQAATASMNWTTPATGGTAKLNAQIFSDSFGISSSNQGSLSIEVTAPFVPFRVKGFYISQSLPTGCNVPVANSSVSAAVANVYAWASVDGVNTGDAPIIDFIAPNGSIYASYPQGRSTSPGSFCLSQGLQIAGSAAASMPGTWSARLRWNNSVVATNNFILIAVPTVKFAVRDLVVTLNVLSNCATPVTTNFVSVSAATVNGWFFVDGANTGDVGVLEFLSPDGRCLAACPWVGFPLLAVGAGVDPCRLQEVERQAVLACGICDCAGTV